MQPLVASNQGGSAMSTGLIIAIVVVALILLAILFFIPRMKRQAELKKRERERQRAEAELHQERATMHERGDADHELIDENERDKFAGTSADRDGTMAQQPRSEFDEGREVGHEEAGDGRFARDEQTTDTPGARRA